MSASDYSWAVPLMRTGYAGRGVTYAAVAGLSLWALWRGGQAQGTGSALETLGTEAWGVVVLWLIAIGLLCYAIWRGIDAVQDLEDYGTEAKGLIARAGMIVTGLIHGVIAGLALSIVFGSGGSSGGQGQGQGGVAQAVGTVLDWPGGRWIIGFAALCTLGAGVYYLGKGWKASYREHLRANHFTRNYDWALRAGVIAQAVIILIIGGFLLTAAWQGSESEAGGIGAAFDWLREQAFGYALVVLVCLGLLGFAFFCFVNAAYRIVPKAADPGIETLGRSLAAKARAASA
jgi:hypothetical protein